MTTTPIPDSPFMTTEEVAAYGRTAPESVRWWRHKGIGPASFKVGRRVLYRREDVEAYFTTAYEAQTAATG